MARNRKIELSTIIGKGTIINGSMEIMGGIRIDGEIEGSTIESNGFVTIGKSAIIKANIKAEECLVSGKVVGNLSVEEAIELDETSNVSGDITAKIFKIHSGAIFNGSSTMKEKQKNILQAEKTNVETKIK